MVHIVELHADGTEEQLTQLPDDDMAEADGSTSSAAASNGASRPTAMTISRSRPSKFESVSSTIASAPSSPWLLLWPRSTADASTPRTHAATVGGSATPARAAAVSNQSIDATSAAETRSAGTRPGHHAISGVDTPPS